MQNIPSSTHHGGFPCGSRENTCFPVQKTWVRLLVWDGPLEEGMATHSGILAWGIPWTEEPGGLQSMGPQRGGHDLATKQQSVKYNGLNFRKEIAILIPRITNQKILLRLLQVHDKNVINRENIALPLLCYGQWALTQSMIQFTHLFCIG